MAAVGEVSVVVWHCAAQRWSVAGVAVHRLCSAVTARTYRITTGLLPPSLRSCHPPPAAVWRSKARQWHAQVAEEGAGEESVEEEVDRARGAGGRRARWRQRREPRSSSATLVRLPPAADAGRRPEEGETRQEEDVREPERRRRSG